jgi:hypothetical protein
MYNYQSFIDNNIGFLNYFKAPKCHNYDKIKLVFVCTLQPKRMNKINVQVVRQADRRGQLRGQRRMEPETDRRPG